MVHWRHSPVASVVSVVTIVHLVRLLSWIVARRSAHGQTVALTREVHRLVVTRVDRFDGLWRHPVEAGDHVLSALHGRRLVGSRLRSSVLADALAEEGHLELARLTELLEECFKTLLGCGDVKQRANVPCAYAYVLHRVARLLLHELAPAVVAVGQPLRHVDRAAR